MLWSVTLHQNKYLYLPKLSFFLLLLVFCLGLDIVLSEQHCTTHTCQKQQQHTQQQQQTNKRTTGFYLISSMNMAMLLNDAVPPWLKLTIRFVAARLLPSLGIIIIHAIFCRYLITICFFGGFTRG